MTIGRNLTPRSMANLGLSSTKCKHTRYIALTQHQHSFPAKFHQSSHKEHNSWHGLSVGGENTIAYLPPTVANILLVWLKVSESLNRGDIRLDRDGPNASHYFPDYAPLHIQREEGERIEGKLGQRCSHGVGGGGGGGIQCGDVGGSDARRQQPQSHKVRVFPQHYWAEQ